MVEQALIFLENLAWVSALRGSTWVYPLVNAGHILGISLLVGGILPLDCRLLGLWRRFPLEIFLTVLRTTSAIGLGLAVVCGLLLFATAASDYAGSTIFQIKMVIVLAGVANAWILTLLIRRPEVEGLPMGAKLPLPVRAGAAVSLGVWLGALMLGRLLGYF